MRVRKQKHHRDLVARKGGKHYDEQRRRGPASLTSLGLFPISQVAPPRRDRVVMEAQTMRLLDSGFNQRSMGGGNPAAGTGEQAPLVFER